MGKVLTVAALTVGAFVAGILLAPKSGKETREEIKHKMDEYRGKAGAGYEEVKKGAVVVKDELVDSAENLRDIAKDATSGVKRTANRVKEEVTTRGKVIQGEVQQTAADTRRAAR
ncbi:hypothetical protein BGO17_01170 [Candidatus Saccharibacteria bacterium 49-20]|nr:MAG: hypothetical protein BGO17_01170 [Candidatus Saccharibacteria bacterium 49-20]